MPRLISFTDDELYQTLELLRVARVHCLELAITLHRVFPDSPLVERMRIYADQAQDIISQIEEAQL
jgi:hypothetical protein